MRKIHVYISLAFLTGLLCFGWGVAQLLELADLFNNWSDALCMGTGVIWFTFAWLLHADEVRHQRAHALGVWALTNTSKY